MRRFFSIAGRCDDRRSCLDSKACLVSHTALTATVSIRLFTMVNADGEIEDVDAVATGSRNGLDEISPLGSLLASDDAVQIKCRLGRKIAKQLEDITSMVCRVWIVTPNVVLLNVNVECLGYLRNRVQQ